MPYMVVELWKKLFIKVKMLFANIFLSINKKVSRSHMQPQESFGFIWTKGISHEKDVVFLQLMHVHEELRLNIHTTTYSIPFIAVFHYFSQPLEWNFRSMPNQLGFICKLSRLCKIEKQFPAKYCFSCEWAVNKLMDSAHVWFKDF
mgnify:CR=1 FL=1